jgi:hypothetical protein
MDIAFAKDLVRSTEFKISDLEDELSVLPGGKKNAKKRTELETTIEGMKTDMKYVSALAVINDQEKKDREAKAAAAYQAAKDQLKVAGGASSPKSDKGTTETVSTPKAATKPVVAYDENMNTVALESHAEKLLPVMKRKRRRAQNWRCPTFRRQLKS